jgi:non-ribosomal peptide synthetase component F
VATPVANRPRVELENMIGFFTNSIVLRLDTSGDPTFRELVGRARHVTREGIARSAVPFERVVEVVDPPRSLGHAPLAQVSFAMVDDPALNVELGDLRVTTVDHHTGSSKYDLTLELWPRAGGGLHGTLEYAADLFDEATAARIASHLGALLDELTGAPQTRIGSARLASEQEMRDTVFDWNQAGDPQLSDPRLSDPRLGELCVHEMFEAQARRTPNAPALMFGEHVLTFAELDRRAERLAARLRLDGVGPQTRVGLFLGRDAELVVAVLATLKAGGAYVPLDLADPAAWTAFVLADADVRVVVTTDRHAAALPADQARVVLANDDGGPEPPAATAWCAATPTGRGSPRNGSCRIRSARSRARGCTAPATSAAGCPREPWSSRVARTTS